MDAEKLTLNQVTKLLDKSKDSVRITLERPPQPHLIKNRLVF